MVRPRSALPLVSLLIVVALFGFGDCLSFAKIFGDDNESRWSPTGRLPDWSYAGYNARDTKPRPPKSTTFNVKDYGARGNGKTDDSNAIQKAINAAAKAGGGIVFVPQGRYLLEGRIHINASYVVLRGSGDNSILYARHSLSYFDGYKFPSSGESRFSWQDGFVGLGPERKDSGNTGFNKKTLLANITGSTKRGYKTLQLDTTSKITPNSWVRLFISDDKSDPLSKSPASELYGGYAQRSSCGSQCLSSLRGLKSSGLNTKGRDLIRWMSRVEYVDGGSNKIVLERPLPLSIRDSWGATLHAISDNTIRHSGIESLSIQFKHTEKRPHRNEAGFNGIFLSDVVDAWVKDVSIVNADNGVLVHRSHFATIDGVTVRVAKSRKGSDVRDGHIGIGLSFSADVEVVNFNIKAVHWHDISVRGTMLCVFHSGKGTDLSIDSHRAGAYATLYSKIDLGKGTQPYITGGMTTRGLPAGQFTTYYNLVRTKSGSQRYKPLELPRDTVRGDCTWGWKLNFRGRFGGKSCAGYYLESDLPVKPPNLFTAQVSERRSRNKS